MDVCAEYKTWNHKTFCNDHKPNISLCPHHSVKNLQPPGRRGESRSSLFRSRLFFHILQQCEAHTALHQSFKSQRFCETRKMDKLLPMRRGDDGDIHLAGVGAVSLRIVYDAVLGKGEHSVVFVGEIIGKSDSRLIMKVSEIVRCGRR